MNELDAMNVTCPRCGADRGNLCVTPTGALAKAIHAVRFKEADQTAEILERAVTKSYKNYGFKPKYKKRIRSWVWCDHHGGLHEAQIDYYDESGYRFDGTPSECNPLNWRRVYVGTDDKKEEF